MRGLVLAHHWTLSEVASLTVEQLVWCRQWQLPAAPARVGRDEARAIVAARREARAEWVSAVLAGRTTSGSTEPQVTETRRFDERTCSRLERSIAQTIARRIVAGRSAAIETPQPTHEREFDLTALTTSARVAEVPAPDAGPQVTTQSVGSLGELIAQLGVQLDRLERRIQRGAPLGP